MTSKSTTLDFSIPNPKIDPARRPSRALRPDGSPDDNDRVEIGPTDRAFEEWAALGLEVPNLDRMRQSRLSIRKIKALFPEGGIY